MQLKLVTRIKNWSRKRYLERLTLQLKAAGIETVATIINYDLTNNFYDFTNPNNVGWLGDKIQIALGLVFLLSSYDEYNLLNNIL